MSSFTSTPLVVELTAISSEKAGFSGQPRPSLAPLDSADVSDADAVLKRDVLVRSGVHSDQADLVLGQFRSSGSRASVRRVVSYTIPLILSGSGPSQVRRIDASRISARVRGLELPGRHAVNDLADQAMDACLRAIASAHSVVFAGRGVPERKADALGCLGRILRQGNHVRQASSVGCSRRTPTCGAAVAFPPAVMSGAPPSFAGGLVAAIDRAHWVVAHRIVSCASAAQTLGVGAAEPRLLGSSLSMTAFNGARHVQIH